MKKATQRVRLGWSLHRKYGYERDADLVTDNYRVWFVKPNVCRTIGKGFTEWYESNADEILDRKLRALQRKYDN